MDSQQTFPNFDEVRILIRTKARKLIGRFGFTTSDREDIEHDLLVELLKRQHLFDPARGSPNTFIRMVVNQGVVVLIRKRTSLARDYRRTPQSLDELRAKTNGADVVEPSVDDQLVRDLQFDVREALASLSDELRSVAELLEQGSKAEAARATGCGREVIRTPVRQIRRHFERRGLGK